MDRMKVCLRELDCVWEWACACGNVCVERFDVECVGVFRHKCGM